MITQSTRSDISASFVRSVLGLGVGTVIQIIFGLAGLMVAVRFISSEEFGVFVLIQVIVSLFIAFGNLAVQDVSVTKFIAESEGEKRLVIAGTALFFNLVFGLLIVLIIIICKPLIFYFLKSERLYELSMQIPLFFILTSFNELLIYILQGFQKYKIIAISQVVNGLMKFVFIFVFLIYIKMNIMGLFYSFYLSYLASIAILYFGIPSRKKLMVSRPLFIDIFLFGFPLGLNRLLAFSFSKIDRLILGAMVNPVGVAYLEVASRIPENGYRLFQSFNSVFFPNMSKLIAENNKIQAEKLLNDSLRVITFVSTLTALVTLLFKEDIVRVLFSDKYLESASALWILMVALSIGLIEYIFGGTLIALGESDKPVKINIVSAITNIAGNFVMIPFYGFVGAAYATILARVITNPIYILFVNKYGLKVNIVMLFTPIAILGVCAGMYIIFGYVGLVYKFTVIIIFIALCLKLSVIAWKDFSTLMKGMTSYFNH
jgi:O-antigen/teichoic acid export membrane protein